MKLKNLDLNLFVTFDAVYTHRNLTLAASALNVTQPAVSNSLARLRDRFNDPLFVHAGRKMNPTPLAQKMIGPTRQALRLLQAGIEEEDKFNPQTSDKVVRIGIGDIGETILLPKLVERLHRFAPLMKVQAFHVPRRSIAKKLALGEIDFAVDIPLPPNPELQNRLLMSDKQVCVVGPSHPLAKKSSLSLEAYLALSHILVSSRQRGSGAVDIELGNLGPTRNIMVRFQHYQAAFHLVQRTDLALTAPLQLTRMYNCHVFSLPLAVPNLDFYLYWHKSTAQAKTTLWLRDLILEAVA
ncbi:LysR family transcriptional regulator [Sneathiella marina]|uniref:LysR family transcriptional regulator n=1 Tax=Sneathiella marina TaxID=2950108 RepID=A0ABY4W0H2_9PROT|nr:LysR family transcriptional regulator [Sneathiella marina]USG60459.1 LysR family transcriptional regulator [Sneathiella marina]